MGSSSPDLSVKPKRFTPFFSGIAACAPVGLVPHGDESAYGREADRLEAQQPGAELPEGSGDNCGLCQPHRPPSS